MNRIQLFALIAVSIVTVLAFASLIILLFNKPISNRQVCVPGDVYLDSNSNELYYCDVRKVWKLNKRQYGD